MQCGQQEQQPDIRSGSATVANADAVGPKKKNRKKENMPARTSTHARMKTKTEVEMAKGRGHPRSNALGSEGILELGNVFHSVEMGKRLNQMNARRM